MEYHIINKQLQFSLWIFFGFILIIIAGLRFLGIDTPDSQAYIDIIRDYNTNKIYEFSFQAIVQVNRFIDKDNYYITFLIFSFLAVGIQCYAIWTRSKIILFSLYIYVSMFFFLHEYVQIRAAVAMGLFLLSIKYLSLNRLKYSLIILMALLFHWSSVMLFVGYTFSMQKNKKISWLFVLPIVGLVINFIDFGVSLRNALQLFLVANGIGVLGAMNDFRVINSMALIFTMFYMVFLFSYIRNKNIFNTNELVMLKFFSVGLSLYYFLGFLAMVTVAFRCLEFFSVVLILLLPAYVSKFTYKYLLSVIYAIPCGLISYHIICDVVFVNYFKGGMF